MNIKGKPLEDIRTEVEKAHIEWYYEVSYVEYEKTGLAVRLSQNLDNYTDEDGNTQYLRDGEAPRAGIIEHRGITQLKAGKYEGQYVITQEILKEGQKRRKSLRKALIVTNAEALKYIIFTDHMEILERPRFFPLKAMMYCYSEVIGDLRKVHAPKEIDECFWSKQGGML